MPPHRYYAIARGTQHWGAYDWERLPELDKEMCADLRHPETVAPNLTDSAVRFAQSVVVDAAGFVHSVFEDLGSSMLKVAQ